MEKSAIFLLISVALAAGSFLDDDNPAASALLARYKTNIMSKAKAASQNDPRYQNLNNLVINKPQFVSLGENNQFYCELHIPSQNVSTCEIKTPGNEIWTITGGQVLDSTGTPVPGFSAVDNGTPERVCGLGINSIQSSDIGNVKKYGQSSTIIKFSIHR